MGNKFLTFSFDDGLEQDKKIIQILKRYHLYGATFNLNSGLLGYRQYIGRIGKCGIREVQTKPEKRDLFSYHEHFRIPQNEIKLIYEGYEIASHGRMHEYTNAIKSEKEFDQCVKEDIKKLSELVNEQVVGFVYPFGACNSRIKDYLKGQGILYARGIKSGKKFNFPSDPYEIQPTCHFTDKTLFKLFDRFLNTESEQDMLFYVWGHGYEFDFGTKDSNWERFEKFCECVGKHREIACVKNRELFYSDVNDRN
ncbi:MAG: polysaccharide deacetylase family protein [Lachnospiraceae bacterium]|nr:polysaccharide deacetylase family protein [Lachnospiraceae bacterium]